MGKKSKAFIFLALILCLVWGVISGYLAAIYLGNKGNSNELGFWGESEACLSEAQVLSLIGDAQSCTDQLKEYYSERFTFAGYDQEGNEIIGEINLSRHEKFPGIFSHGYSILIIHGDQSEYEVITFEDSEHEVVVREELIDFEHIPSPDLSTREEFNIEIKSDRIDIKAEFNNLEGDFIIENSPEYTKYVSVGDVDLQLGDDKFKVNGALSSIYSTDSSKYIFFDGFNDLSLQAYQLVWWDEEDNFYLLDKSDVKSSHEGYKSHSWFLTKKKDGWMAREFDIEGITLKEGSQKEWFIAIDNLPPLSAILRSGKQVDTQGERGIITGETSLKSGVDDTLKSIGTFIYYDF